MTWATEQVYRNNSHHLACVACLAWLAWLHLVTTYIHNFLFTGELID